MKCLANRRHRHRHPLYVWGLSPLRRHSALTWS
jgi:hypothetical protein